MRGTGQPCVAFISLAPQFPKPPSQNSCNESSCAPSKKIASRSQGSHTGPVPLLHSFSGNRSWPSTAVPAPGPHLPLQGGSRQQRPSSPGQKRVMSHGLTLHFPPSKALEASLQQQHQRLPFPRQRPNSHRREVSAVQQPAPPSLHPRPRET